MSLADDLIKEAKARNQGVAQVPVQNVNAAATAADKKPSKNDLILEQLTKLNARIDKIEGRATTQVPIASPAVPAAAAKTVEMTHIHHYQAGKNKFGREYPEGYIISAKAFPVGTQWVKGLTPDDLLRIREAFPRGHEVEFFQAVVDPVLANDTIMQTSYEYKRHLRAQGTVTI